MQKSDQRSPGSPSPSSPAAGERFRRHGEWNLTLGRETEHGALPATAAFVGNVFARRGEGVSSVVSAYL
jgi:hypothetical protein